MNQLITEILLAIVLAGIVVLSLSTIFSKKWMKDWPEFEDDDFYFFK